MFGVCSVSQDSLSGGRVLEGSLVGGGYFQAPSRVTIPLPRTGAFSEVPSSGSLFRGRGTACRQRQGTGCGKLPSGGSVPPGHSQRQRPSFPHCPPLETHRFGISASSDPYSFRVLRVLQASLPMLPSRGHWARSPLARGCCLFFPGGLSALPVLPRGQGEPPWTSRGLPRNVAQSWGRDLEQLRTFLFAFV